MKILNVILLLCLFISSIEALSCRIVPVEKNKTKYLYNLIKGTPNIYWAEATSGVTDDEIVQLKIIEVVRGEKKDYITLSGILISDKLKSEDRKSATNDFNGHKSQDFWDGIFTGRSAFDSDCRLKVYFEIGSKYLIFDKKPFQPKSFELVKSTSDQWYKHVRTTLYPPKKKTLTESAIVPTGESSSKPDETVHSPNEKTTETKSGETEK